MTYANARITIAAVAAVLAIALIAASPAHAACTPSGPPGGSSGNDVLCGTSGPDALFGQGGDDQLRGFGGNDSLIGGDGNDRLNADAGNDTLNGGAGDDEFEGDEGNDLLVGGVGFDRFNGGSGDDQLRASDGGLDSIAVCGSGTDSLEMDLVDFASLVFSVHTGCETVTAKAVNEGPSVVISRRSLRVEADGRAAVRLTCPASLPAPCAGTLRIGRSPKTEGAKQAYGIDQGKSDNVSAPLSRSDRRKLRGSGRITARVTSVEKGQFGDKTTVQTIKLIAQD